MSCVCIFVHVVSIVHALDLLIIPPTYLFLFINYTLDWTTAVFQKKDYPLPHGVDPQDMNFASLVPQYTTTFYGGYGTDEEEQLAIALSDAFTNGVLRGVRNGTIIPSVLSLVMNRKKHSCVSILGCGGMDTYKDNIVMSSAEKSERLLPLCSAICQNVVRNAFVTPESRVSIS